MALAPLGPHTKRRNRRNVRSFTEDKGMRFRTLRGRHGIPLNETNQSLGGVSPMDLDDAGVHCTRADTPLGLRQRSERFRNPGPSPVARCSRRARSSFSSSTSSATPRIVPFTSVSCWTRPSETANSYRLLLGGVSPSGPSILQQCPQKTWRVASAPLNYRDRRSRDRTESWLPGYATPESREPQPTSSSMHGSFTRISYLPGCQCLSTSWLEIRPPLA